jgi:hypothetical protein
MSDNLLNGQPIFNLLFVGFMTEEHFSWVPENSYGFNSRQRFLREEGEWFHSNINADREWTVALFPHADPDNYYWDEAEVYLYDCYNPRENVGFAFRFTTDISEDPTEIREEVIEYIRSMIIPIARIRGRQQYARINLD